MRTIHFLRLPIVAGSNAPPILTSTTNEMPNYFFGTILRQTVFKGLQGDSSQHLTSLL